MERSKDFVKKLMLIGSSAFTLAMTATSPTVHLYFVKLVNPQIYATSGIIETVIAASLTSLMSKEKYRQKIRKVFYLILLFDCIGYATISCLSLSDANLRYIGMSLLESLTITVWMTIMLDSINSAIRGVELTDFQTMNKSFNLWGSAVGGIVSVFVVDTLPLECAILIQCIFNSIYAICDYIAYRMLDNLANIEINNISNGLTEK